MRVGGVPEKLVDEFAARSFVSIGEGRWRRHPSPTLYEGLSGDLRMFDLYRRVHCPLLILHATAIQPGLPPDLVRAMTAYRRGLTRALADLQRERSNVEVVTLPDVDHGGIVTRGAPEVAHRVKTLLTTVGHR